jgi:hypothetical protein
MKRGPPVVVLEEVSAKRESIVENREGREEKIEKNEVGRRAQVTSP